MELEIPTKRTQAANRSGAPPFHKAKPVVSDSNPRKNTSRIAGPQ